MADYLNNRNSKNHAANVKKYQRDKKRVFTVLVDKTDRDIVKWFDNQDNKSEAVRKLIRQSIDRKNRQRGYNDKLRQKRKDNFECIFCGKSDERTRSGRFTCQECADKKREARNKAKSCVTEN